MTTDEQGRLPIQSGLFVESIKIDLPDSQGKLSAYRGNYDIDDAYGQGR